MKQHTDTEMRAAAKATYVAGLIIEAHAAKTLSEFISLQSRAQRAGLAPVKVFSPSGGVDEEAFKAWQDSLHANGTVVRGV